MDLITQRQNKNKLIYFIYHPRGLKISELFFFVQDIYISMDKELKICPNTHISVLQMLKQF